MESTTASAFDRGVSEGLRAGPLLDAVIVFCCAIIFAYVMGMVMRSWFRSAGRAWRGEGRK